MIHIHLVSNTFFKIAGGMEQSIQRITSVLSQIKGFKVHLYIRNGDNAKITSDYCVSYKNLSYLKRNLLEPYKYLSHGYQSDQYKNREIARIELLAIKNEIEKVKLRYKKDKHVIVSFYISSSGFFSQHVAIALNIPHIASVRGSNFSKDFYGFHNIEVVNFVLKYANHVITTNNTQKNILSNFCSVEKITTVYNSIENEMLEKKWVRKKKTIVELFSDSGFEYAKGSHILLKSFEILINKVYTIYLKVFGKVETINNNYWEKKYKQLQKLYPCSFFYRGVVNTKEILKNLMDSDIYCSPTLGEGCSNSRLKALSVGIPIVSTSCGEIFDFCSDYKTNFIRLAQPAEINDFTKSLEKMILKVINNTLKRNENRYFSLVDTMFGPERERTLGALNKKNC